MSFGYHVTNIEKGKLGSISKIQEELEELKDAEKQQSKIMMMVELSDLYGAIEEYCIQQNITMEDLKIFSDITKRAFKNGRR
jgi:phosphoribosyl-ATP pyrophosphohydrolase